MTKKGLTKLELVGVAALAWVATDIAITAVDTFKRGRDTLNAISYGVNKLVKMQNKERFNKFRLNKSSHK